MNVEDSKGNMIKLGDKVTLAIAEATFTLIHDSSRGLCFYTNQAGLEAYVNIEDAKTYGVELV